MHDCISIHFSFPNTDICMINMIKSTTIRNETETLALVIDSCYKAPKLCKYAVVTGNLKLTPIEKEQQ